MDYILFQNNLYDYDLKRAVKEVFGNNINDYFNENDYGYSYLEMILNDEEIDDFESFGEIKEYLIKETLLNDNFISVDYLREYVDILDKNENNKPLLEKVSMNSVKAIENEVNDDYEYLSKNIDSINDEFNLIVAKKKAEDAKREEAKQKALKEELEKQKEEKISSENKKTSGFLRTIKRFYKE